MLVGNLHVSVNLLNDIQQTVHLLNLHDLIRRGSVAVDGNIANFIAAVDAACQLRQTNAPAVFTDIEINHISVLINKSGGMQ